VPSKRKIASKTRSLLATRYPLAFMPKKVWKKPLKIGIREDILARCADLEERAVQLALADYCNGSTYLRKLIAGTKRVDLDGIDCDIITPEQEEHAKEKLERKTTNKPLSLAAE
jgi:ProP effector